MTFKKQIHRYFTNSSGVDAQKKQRVVALGCFDGVHIGHQSVLRAAIKLASDIGAEPALFCFAIPPLQFTQDSSIHLISSIEDRIQFSMDIGIRSAFVSDFNDYRNYDAGRFITEILIGECNAIGTVCGFNFAFGKNRSGNFSDLQKVFKQNSLSVPPVMIGEETVSSTKIRTFLSSGDIDKANLFLGRNFSLVAPVVFGRHDGTRIGFPTLNQLPDSTLALPACGVYVTQTTLPNGKEYGSITDVGFAPTLDRTNTLRLETHLLDTQINYSPKIIRVEFIKRIRGEFKFTNIEQLQAQIKSDADFARRVLSNRI